MLRRGFQLSRLGTELVAVISLTSKVWTLLSDDLSSVIFGQSTEKNGEFGLELIRISERVF